MKKGIILICLACTMLVSMCGRETGGVHGVVEADRANPGTSKSGASVVSGTKRSKAKAEDKRRGAIRKAAHKTNISGKSPESQTRESLASDANNERKPDGLLVKPRVDVPDIK